MKPSREFLRQRKVSSATTLVAESEGDAVENPQAGRERREEVVWGKTPGGEGIAIQFFLDAIHSFMYSIPRTDDT